MQIIKNKVAIYAGSFDPIHIGHITFAIQAKEASAAEIVYFLPERQPYNKQAQEHFAHRVAMIKKAIKPYKQFKVLELDDRQFAVSRTLPKLQKLFEDKDLIFLFGSDKIADLESWPNADQLLSSSEIIIGLRELDDLKTAKRIVKTWPTKAVKIIDSYAPNVSSTTIRSSLNDSQSADGLLASVAQYIRRNWLYVSLSKKL